MFFSTLRTAVRQRKQAESDRDFWKKRALALEQKLDERSDFFIEREYRFMDRWLTADRKTFAITDEIRTKAIVTDPEAEKYALEAFLQDKKEALVEWAREADLPDPEDAASRTFEQNRAGYIIEFQQQRIN